MRLALPLSALLLFSLACGEDPPPSGNGSDSGNGLIDVGFLEDAEARDLSLVLDGSEDAGSSDANGNSDATSDDAADDAGGGGDADPNDGAPSDGSGNNDGSSNTDGAVNNDGGVGADAGPVDTGVVPDAGILTDGDGDNIADQHEGNGLVDTDNDGTPDTADPDSDNDGIPDSVEAGDAVLSTPPRDSDNDGTPDFRDADSDNDLIPDVVEGAADPDNDSTPNFLDADSDGDTIADVDEGAGDPDNDGAPNFIDPDSDGDGLSDQAEAGDTNRNTPPVDSDFDGTPDFRDLDSDADFIPDAVEGNRDSDNDGTIDAVDIDSDNDSILDVVESGDSNLLTAPVNSDTDALPDYRDPDSDNDTISDLHEGLLGNTDGDALLDRFDLDSDGDGVSDAIEAGDANILTFPQDTDGDGVPDFRDLDSDADGLADSTEPGCPAGSSRLLEDSDNDGFLDLAEIGYGSNPCSAASIINDFYFILPPGGPGDDAPLVFSDTNIDRADLAINIDTTGSMGGEIATLRTGLSNTIIPGVDAVIPDAAFSVSSFDDYPINPFGTTANNDIPFRLGTRVTTDAAVAQSAVNALVTHNGIDFPESGLESIYQVCTGIGTSWAGGNVPAFNPATGSVPGVADGTIGGVGFRNDSLPIIVHVTDAISHTRSDYQAVNNSIAAASTANVRAAIGNIGARVVTISAGFRPFDDILCAGEISTFFGAVTPATDVDWFQLQGAVAGNTVSVSVAAAAYSSTLDSMVAVANSTGIIALNDDISVTNNDSRLTNVALTGTGPFYVAVTAFNDPDFNGSGGASVGHYLMDVSLNGTAMMPSPTACRAEDPNTRTNATLLVPSTAAVPAPNLATCEASCDTILGGFSPLFEDFTFPYEQSEDTNAVIPPCAWSQFGPARPTGCAADQCCTGQLGVGEAPNAAGMCPLAFEISATGAGLDTALVTGIQALVNFSTFTLTTVVRPDPAELIATGIDTTCFIHGIIPTNATTPNTCAPPPTPADLFPPSPELDSWLNVVPGTILEFQVNALNQSVSSGLPCAASLAAPRQFRAFIDVVADGVTVVDTRDVIIIVPPLPPEGGG